MHTGLPFILDLDGLDYSLLLPTCSMFNWEAEHYFLLTRLRSIMRRRRSVVNLRVAASHAHGESCLLRIQLRITSKPSKQSEDLAIGIKSLLRYYLEFAVQCRGTEFGNAYSTARVSHDNSYRGWRVSELYILIFVGFEVPIDERRRLTSSALASVYFPERVFQS